MIAPDCVCHSIGFDLIRHHHGLRCDSIRFVSIWFVCQLTALTSDISTRFADRARSFIKLLLLLLLLLLPPSCCCSPIIFITFFLCVFVFVNFISFTCLLSRCTTLSYGIGLKSFNWYGDNRVLAPGEKLLMFRKEISLKNKKES